MRILAVDDDPGFLRTIERACREAGITCIGAQSAEEAVGCARESGPGQFDVVLLDVHMPGIDGWDCCSMLRKIDPQLAVVFLTDLSSPTEADQGLALGAEDIIIKPTTLDALAARLKYLRGRHERPHSIRVGTLRFNLVQHSAEICGRPIDLTHQEFRLLLELALARGATISKVTLLQRIWPADPDPATNRVEVHVANLRRKLKQAGVDVVRTVWGEGYALTITD